MGLFSSLLISLTGSWQLENIPIGFVPAKLKIISMKYGWTFGSRVDSYVPHDEATIS